VATRIPKNGAGNDKATDVMRNHKLLLDEQNFGGIDSQISRLSQRSQDVVDKINKHGAGKKGPITAGASDPLQ
jgi:hypothetical protein